MFAPNISYNISAKTVNISEDEIVCFDKDIEYGNYSYPMILSLKMLYNYNDALIPTSIPAAQYHGYIDTYLHQMVSDSQTASIVSFVPSFNPLEKSAIDPSLQMRALIDSINRNESMSQGTTFYIHQSLFWEIDSMEQTADRLPWMLTIIIVSIFVLIGVMFKAAFLPFRLLLVIIIPIAFVYGCAVGVYVLGWLDWLNLR